jgi:hypothetical protein
MEFASAVDKDLPALHEIESCPLLLTKCHRSQWPKLSRIKMAMAYKSSGLRNSVFHSDFRYINGTNHLCFQRHFSREAMVLFVWGALWFGMTLTGFSQVEGAQAIGKAVRAS